MSDYEQLQMSIDVFLYVIDSMVKIRPSFRNPCYKDLINRLVGVKLVVVPFPELEQKVEDRLTKVEALQRAIDL